MRCSGIFSVDLYKRVVLLGESFYRDFTGRFVYPLLSELKLYVCDYLLAFVNERIVNFYCSICLKFV
jgi:hypothetical protein